MKALVILLSMAPLAAQDSPALQPPSAEGSPVSSAAPAAEATAQLPPAEQRVRVGILLLQQLEQLMAGVDSEEKAAAAVTPAMQLCRDLQLWFRSFAELPPLSESEQQAYEDAYLPTIRRLNNRIRTQGERLAAAKYYGSTDLPAALMHLALLNQ